MNFSRDSRVDFPRKSANGLHEQGQEIGMECLWQRLTCFKFPANAKWWSTCACPDVRHRGRRNEVQKLWAAASAAPSADCMLIQYEVLVPLLQNGCWGNPSAHSDRRKAERSQEWEQNNDDIHLKWQGRMVLWWVQFKIRRHTALNKLMKAYWEWQGLSVRQIRFRFDGQSINEKYTSAKLEMEDKDTIAVFQQQVGGIY